jgi:hypothetical protein
MEEFSFTVGAFIVPSQPAEAVIVVSAGMLTITGLLDIEVMALIDIWGRTAVTEDPLSFIKESMLIFASLTELGILIFAAAELLLLLIIISFRSAVILVSDEAII